MSENLSIDEIIKQAEEIRKRAVDTTHSSVEKQETAEESGAPVIDVDSADEDIKISIPVSQEKTTQISREEISRAAAQEKNGAEEKTIQVELDGKTGIVPDVKDIKKSKKSFFNNQNYEPVYSKQPPELVERPATVKTKSRLSNTADLEEIPTIVAVEELEKTRISFNRAEEKAAQPPAEEEEESAQIVLEGFVDSTEEVEKIDERTAEELLRERRRDKVSKFRVFSPDDEQPKTADKVIKNEYESNDERGEFLDKLYESKKSTATQMLITLVLTIITGALTLMKDSSFLPSFLMESTPFLITLLVLYAVNMLVNLKTVMHGFKTKNGINSDFPISLVSVFVLLHTVLLLINNDVLLDEGAIYVFSGSFALLMGLAGKYTLLLRIINNFKYISSKSDKYIVETIVNNIDASIISRGLLTGEANLKTSIKTDFPTRFLDIACADEPADSIAKNGGFVMLALNFILFVVISILNKSWHIGLNAAACGICISMPCITLFSTNSALLDLSKLIKKNGAAINGYEGANSVIDANAIVIEAHDLFASDSCEIHGIKTFNGAKADDVILKTAAVIINTKSPLAYVFDDVIIGKKTILPEVDSIVYEDRLGTSAWIYKKKVLVGTRELLIHHGVQVPSEDYEKQYLRKGRKILYLADTGKLVAMYVVSYSADPVLKKALKRLEKSGMTILVRSADPFINDDSIAELFGLPKGYVRVMSSANGRVFEKYSNMHADKSPAYVVHNGTALGFVTAMSAAENLAEIRRMLSVLICFGCAIGFGVVALLSGIGGFSQLNAVSVVVFQLFWLLFTEGLSKLKRIGY